MNRVGRRGASLDHHARAESRRSCGAIAARLWYLGQVPIAHLVPRSSRPRGNKAEGRRASPDRPPGRRFGWAGCCVSRSFGLGRDKSRGSEAASPSRGPTMRGGAEAVRRARCGPSGPLTHPALRRTARSPGCTGTAAPASCPSGARPDLRSRRARPRRWSPGSACGWPGPSWSP